MAEISYDESVRQTSKLSLRARDAMRAGEWGEAIAAWTSLLGHPCAHHQIPAYEVWDEIHQAHRQAGRFDDAIAAKRTAIEAGYRSEPDPEADIAECHLLAGRRADADQLFAELRDRDPGDAWLYNAAGAAYADAGDHEEAKRWLRAGIDTALRTGDPDLVAPQLLGMLEGSRAALGEQPDSELVSQVETFAEAWEPVDRPRRGDDFPVEEERACGYCGFDPDSTYDQMAERARRNRSRILQQEMPEAFARLEALPSFGPRPERERLVTPPRLAVGWFPASEWAAAIDRWPRLLDDNPADHARYSHEIEARTKRIARAVAGQPLHIAPLAVNDLEDFAAIEGEDPGTAEMRASYAAEVLAQGLAIVWPPERNQPCWCGSGRKYKKCCGPVPVAPDG